MGLSSFSIASDPEGLLRTAFGTLRGSAAVALKLQGFERVSGTSRTVTVDATVDNVSPQPRFVLTASKDGVESHRWAADGSNFTFLDRQNLEARASAYTGADGGRSAIYQSLVSTSTGPAIYPSKLMRDLFAGDSATFKTWMPEALPTWGGDQVWTWIAYTSNARQVIYWLETPSGNLSAIDYKYNDGTREGQWRMNLTTYTFLQPNWSFNFVPPAGVRMIAMPKSG